MAIEDVLRGATVSMNRWRNGVKDDGPSGAARADYLHRCAEAAAAELDTMRDAQNVLMEALGECINTMDHARVFVNSRERIKQPEGAELYDEALTKARKALAYAQTKTTEGTILYPGGL